MDAGGGGIPCICTQRSIRAPTCWFHHVKKATRPGSVQLQWWCVFGEEGPCKSKHLLPATHLSVSMDPANVIQQHIKGKYWVSEWIGWEIWPLMTVSAGRAPCKSSQWHSQRFPKQQAQPRLEVLRDRRMRQVNVKKPEEQPVDARCNDAAYSFRRVSHSSSWRPQTSHHRPVSTVL